MEVISAAIKEFQSTPPERGATAAGDVEPGRVLFQSTPPERGATGHRRNQPDRERISIHAPREGSDLIDTTVDTEGYAFQSTPPERGATRKEAAGNDC